jgi:hypothetical protein
VYLEQLDYRESSKKPVILSAAKDPVFAFVVVRSYRRTFEPTPRARQLFKGSWQSSQCQLTRTPFELSRWRGGCCIGGGIVGGGIRGSGHKEYLL